ncbi:hypothetical protein DL765_005176 [Monosporascus sp. GIB2]|nr:hypothetical protein DL765_005176 [Monosporascus sp. GIB2]
MASPAAKVMRAWLYSNAATGLHKNLTLSTAAAHPRQISKLAADELLIHVRATGLNPADYKIPELPYGMSRLMVSVPASPGFDFAGTVTALGGGVKVAAVGDSVFGRLDPTRFGSLGEYIVARSSGCARMPQGLSFEDASAIGSAGLASYNSIAPYVPDTASTKKDGGFRVFINGGSGGTGTFGIQIAKLLGCHVTTSCSARNLELCKALGADEVIDYTQGNLVETLKAKGPVFSLAVDNVGLPADLYTAADHFLLPKGTFVQVGADVSMAGNPESLQNRLLTFDLEVRLMTSRMLRPSILGGGSRTFKFLAFANKTEDLARIAGWIADGKMKVALDEVFDFENAPAAYEKLRQGHARGKIVVRGATQPSS